MPDAHSPPCHKEERWIEGRGALQAGRWEILKERLVREKGWFIPSIHGRYIAEATGETED